MSITIQHAKENLCAAHIHALAGMAGTAMALRYVHDYGVDGQFDPVIVRNKRRHVCGFSLPFQAKATTKWEVIDNHIVYNLESKTYNDIVCRSEAESTLLLVLLCLPKDQLLWHRIDQGFTTLQHCCYYDILKGDPVENEKSTKRIKIPVDQVLTPSVLVELLDAEKARREGQVL
ncbi:DUF4365 domain-containing protein [Novosphingobium sp.]|uniref:DUF4365 domain-containing protein n=1 Tax=Novosphingobium sp. TaxID=1874826 RepID=UPI00262E13E4|nr:DUF4365 domain-containing protein [Novosphingobium sp.]